MKVQVKTLVLDYEVLMVDVYGLRFTVFHNYMKCKHSLYKHIYNCVNSNAFVLIIKSVNKTCI